MGKEVHTPVYIKKKIFPVALTTIADLGSLGDHLMLRDLCKLSLVIATIADLGSLGVDVV